MKPPLRLRPLAPARLAGAMALALLAAPRLAEACAVCMAGRDDETRTAFLLTTLLLTLLPLAVLGMAAWWFVRRVRAVEGGGGRESERRPARAAAQP